MPDKPSPADADLATAKEVLRAVATYRLMSRALLLRAGVARNPKRITHAIRYLVRRKWVKETPAKRIAGASMTRVESLLYLTDLGADVANELMQIDTRGSRRTFGTENEVDHRLGIVETHMALRGWAGELLAWFVSDFEPGSAGREKATTITGDGLAFSPDGLACLMPDGWPPQILVIEVERGGARGDLWRFLREKLPHLRNVAESELVEKRFKTDDLASFLIVFATDALRDCALERWDDPAAAIWDRFYVKSLPELHAASFNEGWWQPSRPRCPLIFKAS